MIEDSFFLDDGHVKITAASVGISKLRWTSVKEQEIDNGLHFQLMKKNRFDHLPIVPDNGPITEYFKTEIPNQFDKITRNRINYDDIISLDTDIRDVIDKFANKNRTFYFLHYQKRISGLITLGNLNCRQVQVYLFSHICELERKLSYFLNNQLSNQEIENWVQSKIIDGDPKCKYKLIIENYKSLEDSSLENHLTEQLFLVDFFNIITNKKLFVNLDYDKSKWQELSSINELRKRIAHPTRSLIDKENNIFKLQERIKKMEELTFRLNTRRRSNIY
jgi:hypothetical protein